MLIHACCADCFLKLYDSLNQEQRADVEIFFYNPNIYPREEYSARLVAIKKIVKKINKKIKIIVSNYLPQEYFQTLQKIEKQQENRENKQSSNLFTIIPQKERCPLCWELRLRKLFEVAKKNNISQVSSTLFSSSYQDLKKIKQIAQKLSQEYQIDFYFPSLSKEDRHKSNRGFYKQNYCGCLYSLLEKSREKYQL